MKWKEETLERGDVAKITEVAEAEMPVIVECGILEKDNIILDGLKYNTME